MPSSYTPLLRLTLPADGELVGTWGQTVNTQITALEETAIAGTAAVPVTDGADTVLTVANGAADQARAATLRLTGVLTAQRNVICPSSSKNYFVRNATTGGFGVQIKTAAGAGVVVPAGGAMLVYCDGASVMQAVTTGDFVKKTGDTMSGPLQIEMPAGGGPRIGFGQATVGSWAVGLEANVNALQFRDFTAGGAGVEVMRIQDRTLGVGSGSNTIFGKLARVRALEIDDGTGVFNTFQAYSNRNGGTRETSLIQGMSQNPGVESASIRFAHNSSVNLAGALTFWTTTSANVPTEQMRIDKDGNVMIGTTGPAAAALQVKRAGIASIAIEGGAGDSQSAAVYIAKAGGVGGSMLVMGDAAAIAGGAVNTTSMILTNTTPLSFVVNGAERMRISATGGVTMPQALIVGGTGVRPMQNFGAAGTFAIDGWNTGTTSGGRLVLLCGHAASGAAFVALYLVSTKTFTGVAPDFTATLISRSGDANPVFSFSVTGTQVNLVIAGVSNTLVTTFGA